MDLFDGTYELVQGISIHEVLFGRGLVLRSMRIQRLHIRVHSCSPSTLATVHQKLLVLLDRFIIHVRLVLQYAYELAGMTRVRTRGPPLIHVKSVCLDVASCEPGPPGAAFCERQLVYMMDGLLDWIANSELFSNYI